MQSGFLRNMGECQWMRKVVRHEADDLFDRGVFRSLTAGPKACPETQR